MQKAAKVRRWRDGYEPSWVKKAADYPNWYEPPGDQPTELGRLTVGDSFYLADASVTASQGIVLAEERVGLVRVDTGTGSRYLPATTPVTRSAAEG